MHILITGNGKAGSWKIRGEQLGTAIGAEICPNAGKRDIADADLVIVVKRTPDSVIQHLRELGKTWIWDVVDAWPQPCGNDWARTDAIAWIRGTLDYLKPSGVVFPTKTMGYEAQFGGTWLYLPHHARPELVEQKVPRDDLCSGKVSVEPDIIQAYGSLSKLTGMSDVRNLARTVEESLLPELPCSLHEAVALKASADAAATGKNECTLLRKRLSAAREAYTAAVQSLRSRTSAEASSGLQQATGSDLALSGVPSGAPRHKVSSVVYEGAEHYLGKWRSIVDSECASRGWNFLINPKDIREGDIGIALRDVTGWPGTAWKSNVKLANIQAAGLPFVGSRERGYMETGNGSEFYVSDGKELCEAFNRLESYEVRRRIYAEQRECAPKLETVAKAYAAWLAGFSSCAGVRSLGARESA